MDVSVSQSQKDVRDIYILKLMFMRPAIQRLLHVLQALKEKELGNAAYKQKDLDTAIEHYTKGYELDPTNVALLTNRAGISGLFAESVNLFFILTCFSFLKLS